MNAVFLVLAAVAYLCGSVPFGKIVGQRYGIDIQRHGTGNIGFANVRRTLGWKPGLIVLVMDVAKGWLPVMVAGHYLSGGLVLIVGVMALLGHIFPVWLGFRGGKGIATGLGVIMALDPLLGGAGLAIYGLGIGIYRKSAPASVTAVWALPLFSWWLAPRYVAFCFGLAVLASWTHRGNLRKLLAKT